MLFDFHVVWLKMIGISFCIFIMLQKNERGCFQAQGARSPSGHSHMHDIISVGTWTY